MPYSSTPIASRLSNTRHTDLDSYRHCHIASWVPEQSFTAQRLPKIGNVDYGFR